VSGHLWIASSSNDYSESLQSWALRGNRKFLKQRTEVDTSPTKIPSRFCGERLLQKEGPNEGRLFQGYSKKKDPWLEKRGVEQWLSWPYRDELVKPLSRAKEHQTEGIGRFKEEITRVLWYLDMVSFGAIYIIVFVCVCLGVCVCVS